MNPKSPSPLTSSMPLHFPFNSTFLQHKQKKNLPKKKYLHHQLFHNHPIIFPAPGALGEKGAASPTWALGAASCARLSSAEPLDSSLPAVLGRYHWATWGHSWAPAASREGARKGLDYVGFFLGVWSFFSFSYFCGRLKFLLGVEGYAPTTICHQWFWCLIGIWARDPRKASISMSCGPWRRLPADIMSEYDSLIQNGTGYDIIHLCMHTNIMRRYM